MLVNAYSLLKILMATLCTAGKCHLYCCCSLLSVNRSYWEWAGLPSQSFSSTLREYWPWLVSRYKTSFPSQCSPSTSPKPCRRERRRGQIENRFTHRHFKAFVARVRLTDHFVLPPAPLEVHSAVESPLEDGPASATRLHVAVNLQMRIKTQLTAQSLSKHVRGCEPAR